MHFCWNWYCLCWLGMWAFGWIQGGSKCFGDTHYLSSILDSLYFSTLFCIADCPAGRMAWIWARQISGRLTHLLFWWMGWGSKNMVIPWTGQLASSVLWCCWFRWCNWPMLDNSRSTWLEHWTGVKYTGFITWVNKFLHYLNWCKFRCKSARNLLAKAMDRSFS